MNETRTSNLLLSMQPDQLGEFFVLLQRGVKVVGHVGCTLDRLLIQQWGISQDYAAERITTIFLDSRPIDDITTAVIRADAVLALSGAMPGLVGATMRRGGYYAAMRAGITHHDNVGADDDRIGTVRVKLFNLLLPELGPGFLKRGIILSASELGEFLKGRSDSFWQGCHSVLLNSVPISLLSLLQENLFLVDSAVCLSVVFEIPEVSHADNR